jgi:hypothetical protein
MPHLDDDALALLALQAQAPESETAAHLDSCERCRGELDELRRVVTAGRTNVDAAHHGLTAPAAHVWDGIAAGVGLHAGQSTQQTMVEPRTQGAVTRLRPRTQRRSVPTWLAVAAGVVAGVSGAVAFQALETGSSTPEDSVIADAELSEFGATGTSGTAEIRDTDAARVVHISLDEPAEGSGFREVWLLNAQTGDLISLGVLNGTESTLALPDGLDLRDYPVVDISREPLDGDPAHSSDSIARGELQL